MPRTHIRSRVKFEDGGGKSSPFSNLTWFNIEVPAGQEGTPITIEVPSDIDANTWLPLVVLSSTGQRIRVLTPEEIAAVGPHVEMRLSAAMPANTECVIHTTT